MAMDLTPDEAEILWAIARGSEAWTTHPLAQRLVDTGFAAVDGQWLKLTDLGRQALGAREQDLWRRHNKT